MLFPLRPWHVLQFYLEEIAFKSVYETFININQNDSTVDDIIVFYIKKTRANMNVDPATKYL